MEGEGNWITCDYCESGLLRKRSRWCKIFFCGNQLGIVLQENFESDCWKLGLNPVYKGRIAEENKSKAGQAIDNRRVAYIHD